MRFLRFIEGKVGDREKGIEWPQKRLLVLFIIVIGNLLPLQRCNDTVFHISMLA